MPLLSYALVTLGDLKDALEITDGSQDTYLTSLINRATNIIEKYCNGRRFKETVYSNEEYNGIGGNFLNIKHYPIISITNIEKRTGDFASPNWDSLDSSFYKMLDTEGQIYYTLGFNAGIRNYRINYSAGYTDIPEDLQQACITLISYLKNQEKTAGMQSETMGELSYIKTDDEKATIKNLGLDEVLDYYRTPLV
jgi:hypothetical protein